LTNSLYYYWAKGSSTVVYYIPQGHYFSSNFCLYIIFNEGAYFTFK